MLSTKRSVSVTSEVNLGNSLHTGEKGSTQALKPRTDVTRSPKQGYHWPHKKDLRSPIFLKKTVFHLMSERIQNVFFCRRGRVSS